MLAYHLDPDVDLASRNAAFIDRSVQWICQRLEVGPQTRVADFGCGPGLYAARLARNRARVTAIDFSERSIRHARAAAAQEGLAIHFEHQDYLEFEPEGRFQLVLMIMCDFCVLGPDRRRALLQKFHRILEPGGTLLLDVNSLAAFSRRAEGASYEEGLLGGFWSPERYYGFLNTFKYEPERVVLDRYTIVERGRTRSFYNWFQHFSTEALEQELTAAGLEVDAFFGDVAGAPLDPAADVLAVVARRPA
jgi:SAM-dependent methyltransferase